MLSNDEQDSTENKFLYQGKEWQSQLALNLYDFHARQYDPATGRFLGVDPQDQFMSGYVGMGNNPMMMVDPDGKVAFLAVALKAIKLAWAGTKIAAASYTAQVALSPGGFDNWNGDQFKKSLLKGAISGVVTGGIGKSFGGVDKFGQGFNLKKELFRAVTHASANTLIGASFGDEVNGGTFLASFGGSFAGSLMQGAGFNKFETIAASAALAGGIAEISGKGDFWRAAGASVTVSLLNHLGDHGGNEDDEKRTEGFHYVKNGETLESVAKKYNISVDELRRWNRFDWDGHSQKVTGGNILIVKFSAYLRVLDSFNLQAWKRYTVGMFSGAASGVSVGYGTSKALGIPDSYSRLYGGVAGIVLSQTWGYYFGIHMTYTANNWYRHTTSNYYGIK